MHHQHGSGGWYDQHWRTSDLPLERRVDLSGLRSPGAEFVEMRPATPPRPEPHFDLRFSHLQPINDYSDAGPGRHAYDGYQPTESYFDPLRGSLFLNERQFGPSIQLPEPERPVRYDDCLLTPELVDHLWRDALQQARVEPQHPFPTDPDSYP